MNPNGQLPPAPPPQSATIDDRIARVEVRQAESDQAQLVRNVVALREEVRHLANDLYMLRSAREATYDSLHEMAAALLRQQRITDRLERQIQGMLAAAASA